MPDASIIKIPPPKRRSHISPFPTPSSVTQTDDSHKATGLGGCSTVS